MIRNYSSKFSESKSKQEKAAGAQSTPVSDFGVGKWVAANQKARIKGVLGKNFRCCILLIILEGIKNMDLKDK